MSKIVPLISSGVAGPLGVLHLPRFWQKVSLEAAAKLADDYPGCGGGYDQMVLDGLGLDREAALDYIKQSKPTYPQFENWVKQQEGVKLDRGSVTSLNASIAGYVHSEETRKMILEANEIEDAPDAPHDAVNLNNLDDWLAFYNSEIK